MTPLRRAVHVRRAAEADAEAISGILHDAFVAFRPLYTPEAFSATVATPDEIRRRMREGPVFLAELDGAAVGTAAVVSRGAGTWYVRGVAVLPGARGLGAGASLMAEAERIATASLGVRLTLTTAPFLSAAVRLYERLGFRVAAGVEDYHGTRLIRMEKILRSPVLGSSP